MSSNIRGSYNSTLSIILSTSISFIIFVSFVHGQNDFKESDTCESLSIPCLTDLRGIEHILPEICQHLNIQDLRSAQSVCSLFKKAALEVLQNRGPEFKILKIHHNYGEHHNRDDQISKLIGISPRAALFFTNKEHPLAFYGSVSGHIYAQFVPELPPRIQICHVQALEVLLNDQAVDISANNILGFFLPEPRQDKVVVRSFSLNDYYSFQQQEFSSFMSYITNIFDIPKTQINNHNLGLILFNLQIGDVDIEDGFSLPIKTSWLINQEIKEVYLETGGNFALWGFNADWVTGFGLGIPPELPLASLATTISGPGVECWSIAIDKRQSESHISQRITTFHKNIKINRKSFSLAILSIGGFSGMLRRDFKEPMLQSLEIFRKVFPELPIMSFGIRNGLPKYCFNSFDPYNGRIKYDQDFICYLVVTYL